MIGPNFLLQKHYTTKKKTKRTKEISELQFYLDNQTTALVQLLAFRTVPSSVSFVIISVKLKLLDLFSPLKPSIL
jgi:hypothetical protein